MDEVGVFCGVCGWWNNGLSDVCMDCDRRLIDERPLRPHDVGAWIEAQVGQRNTLGIPTMVGEMNMLHEWVAAAPILAYGSNAGNAPISGTDIGMHRGDMGAAKSGIGETWKVLLYVSLTLAAVVAIYAAIGYGMLSAETPSTPQDKKGQYAETADSPMLLMSEASEESVLDATNTDSRSTA